MKVYLLHPEHKISRGKTSQHPLTSLQRWYVSSWRVEKYRSNVSKICYVSSIRYHLLLYASVTSCKSFISSFDQETYLSHYLSLFLLFFPPEIILRVSIPIQTRFFFFNWLCLKCYLRNVYPCYFCSRFLSHFFQHTQKEWVVIRFRRMPSNW